MVQCTGLVVPSNVVSDLLDDVSGDNETLDEF